MKTLIRNGAVCFEDRLERADILVVDQVIADVQETIRPSPDMEIIDATGTSVLPGLIDIHTHLDDRIGEYELADTYETGTRIAVENGITTLFTFITQRANESLGDAISVAAHKAEGHAHADYVWHLTPTRFDADGMREVREWIARGFRTLKLYTTYRRAGIFSDYGLIDTLFGALAPLGVQFLVHCEDDSILTQAQEQTMDCSDPHSHALMRPPEAEIEAIRNVLASAEKHGARVHIVHVSTSDGADMIARARSKARVTCETAPQYLFLNEDQFREAGGHRWICSPPLRAEKVRKALAARAVDGVIDLYATDHCAFRRVDKDAQRTDVRQVPNGLAGIGALPHLILDLYREGLPGSLVAYAQRLSTNPAKVTGLYPRKGRIAAGADADLVLLRMNGVERPVRSSRAEVHETYPGRMSRLEFKQVLLRGNTVVRDGVLVAPGKPKGQCLCRW